MDVPHWFLINMFLRFGFSRCLQALVHWCGFHAARGESEWCIGLLGPTVMSCCSNSCCNTSVKLQVTYFPVHHASIRALSCCDTRLRTSHQICGLPTNRRQSCRLRDMDSHSVMHLSETASRHTSLISCCYSQNGILCFTR